jgi:DNA-binding MarR family transcriptional regulator
MSKLIDFTFEKPEDNNGYLLWQVTMLWQRKMKKALDKIALTHTQFVLMAALGWLSKFNEMVTQVDIANHSNTDRMMVSKVLRTLTEKGLIVRREHETDTRAKCILLTKMGQEKLQKALKLVSQVDKVFFAVLEIHENTFNKYMQKLVAENEQAT